MKQRARDLQLILSPAEYPSASWGAGRTHHAQHLPPIDSSGCFLPSSLRRDLLTETQGWRGTSYLVTLFRLVVPVGVWEVDVAARVLHHFFNVVTALANDVGVLCVRDIHLQRDAVALQGSRVTSRCVNTIRCSALMAFKQ